MAECSSDPTAGCENSELVVKISDCCEETNGNLTSINAKLESISTEQAACCSNITSKLDTIAGLLQQIVDK